MKRYGMVIKVKSEKLEEYKNLHAAVWPKVLDTIRKCNIRNYSIYHKDGYLFSYFEYIGEDFEADMAKMAADPTTQKWWDVCGGLIWRRYSIAIDVWYSRWKIISSCRIPGQCRTLRGHFQPGFYGHLYNFPLTIDCPQERYSIVKSQSQ
jgi:L-rhamnose mutarotase